IDAATGEMDLTFGTGGEVMVDVAGNSDRVYDLLQVDSRIIGVGQVDLGAGDQSDFVLLSFTNASGALPVELAAFTARADGHDVVLRWRTMSERNNAGFAVERAHGAQWHESAFVPGHGSTTAPSAYEHRLEGL